MLIHPFNFLNIFTHACTQQPSNIFKNSVNYLISEKKYIHHFSKRFVILFALKNNSPQNLFIIVIAKEKKNIKYLETDKCIYLTIKNNSTQKLCCYYCQNIISVWWPAENI